MPLIIIIIRPQICPAKNHYCSLYLLTNSPRNSLLIVTFDNHSSTLLIVQCNTTLEFIMQHQE